jgi:hypothetical protein
MAQDQHEFAIDPSLALAIEDAIMFGKDKELALILDDIEDDETFPPDLRRDLESLRYFREHYGRMPLEGMDKKKIALMDSAWGMELLNRLRQNSGEMATRRA